jgi:hypothetical protein
VEKVENACGKLVESVRKIPANDKNYKNRSGGVGDKGK